MSLYYGFSRSCPGEALDNAFLDSRPVKHYMARQCVAEWQQDPGFGGRRGGNGELRVLGSVVYWSESERLFLGFPTLPISRRSEESEAKERGNRGEDKEEARKPR